MDRESIERAYRRYAPVYDSVFGPVLHPGRKRIVENLQLKAGDRILEIGVGTGLSLPLYPTDVEVTGIDVSNEMLERARERVRRESLTQVKAIEQMDALNMRFADKSFDKTVLMYVVSVVDDVKALIDEVRRVTRDDGEIFIVNHFRSEAGWPRKLEGWLSPLASALGFHSDLELDEFLIDTGLKVESVTPVNMFGYWKLVKCKVTCRSARKGAIDG